MKTGKTKRNYRVDEVAEILNCSSRTVYRLVADGEIIAFRLRSALRVSSSSLEFFIKRQISAFQFENGIIENENSVPGSPPADCSILK